MSFPSDLASGLQGEGRVLLWLARCGAFVSTAPSGAYDGDGFVKYEVKNDRKATETGNLFIETHGKNGKPSGVTVTNCLLWFHVVDNEVWVFWVPRLRHLVELPHWRPVKNVGDGNASGVLLPIEGLRTMPIYGSGFWVELLSDAETKERTETL